MSRLVEKDIRDIQEGIGAYNARFRAQTGCSLEQVARAATGISSAAPRRVGVVSVTSGLGVISGFAGAVCATLRAFSIDAFVPGTCDVDGLYEALRRGADVLFMADDARFVAFGASARGLADNGACTGAGFAQALLCAMGERRERVLVLGASAVGGAAARHLLGRGLAVDLWDIEESALAAAEASGEGLTKLKKSPILREYSYILDATPAAGLITAADVGGGTVIAAPGMPLGVTAQACGIATVLHNPLELGVLTMYYECLRQMEEAAPQRGSGAARERTS